MEGVVAAAGNLAGGSLAKAILRQGKTPQDIIRETEKTAIEKSRRELSAANDKAIKQLQNALKEAQGRYSSTIEMGQRAYNAFNETLGLTQTVSQKQQVLQNVIAGKSSITDLANLFPGIDTNKIQQDLFSPKKVNETYQVKLLGTQYAKRNFTEAEYNKMIQASIPGWQAGGRNYDVRLKALQRAGVDTTGMTAAQLAKAQVDKFQVFDETRTRQINDPNFQAPDQAALQKYITDQALAKGQLDPFDARSPLEKYQDTAGFGISQKQIADAQNVLARKAAGSGMLQSGNFANALARKGVDMGNEAFGQYQQNLLASAGQGMQAQGQYDQTASGYNNSIASLLRQAGVDSTNFNMLNASSREKWIQNKPGYDGGLGMGSPQGGGGSGGSFNWAPSPSSSGSSASNGAQSWMSPQQQQSTSQTLDWLRQYGVKI